MIRERQSPQCSRRLMVVELSCENILSNPGDAAKQLAFVQELEETFSHDEKVEAGFDNMPV